MIIQYYYKEEKLPIQNIGTGNPKHQEIIEKFLARATLKVALFTDSLSNVLTYSEVNDRLEVRDDLDKLYTDR